jgi:hypothetical protein
MGNIDSCLRKQANISAGRASSPILSPAPAGVLGQMPGVSAPVGALVARAMARAVYMLISLHMYIWICTYRWRSNRFPVLSTMNKNSPDT